MDGHTSVVLRRDGIPLVAQAYFATACDTLDATGMGNRCAIMNDVICGTAAAAAQIRQQIDALERVDVE